MEAFMRSDQFHFIKQQTQNLINAHSSANDKAVLQAVKAMALERAIQLFPELSAEQRDLLNNIVHVKAKEDAEVYLGELKPFVIPFQSISEKTLQKLFPKVKKLKMPSLGVYDLKEISYLAWDDKGTFKRYLIAHYNDKLVGLHGIFTPAIQKSICTICNKHTPVGLFSVETKGQILDTYTSRGNYICQDSMACNMHVTSLEKVQEFVETLQAKVN
ncbi:elongation factor G-binding protein [Bacillus sp. HMF5848]|uniref:FusB/FusC family EF-G-binding protein n=1 Tax=Bacillus sp. HMF5848 TaxID=2495421 RepID=UPI000F78CD78|nr:FusB/FusC family EF-G-binding protein [Bacillus sp. HMF5848]RSK26042.1 elongation factor G-binding protein [Bacillus sp. HMF5848]